MLKINDLIEIEIEKIVFGGEGLGYYKDFAIFVPMSVPCDKLLVRLISLKKNYGRALIEKIISPSAERVDSNKITFEDFDGCDFAMLKYDAQLKYKKLMVEEVIKKIAGIENFSLEKIHESEKIFHYRNKIIEPFSFQKNKIISGFYSKKSHNVFEVEKNILNSELANEIINKLKIFLNEEKISVYDERKHRGLLRNVMLRTNSKNEAMLALIINDNKINDKLKNILEKIYDEVEELKSVYVSFNTKKANTLLGDKNILIKGQKIIEEEIENIKFQISPTSFFQINLEQAKKLYGLALSYIDNIRDKNLVDAYSGTGTIAMLLAKEAKKVFAIEYVISATKDGIKAAEYNNIKNIDFINGKVELELNNILKKGEKIDAIVFDPPRKGLEANIIDEVAAANIKEIIYISCNPSTFARDLKLLSSKGYVLKKLEAVDMFPQTAHVECIALIQRVKS